MDHGTLSILVTQNHLWIHKRIIIYQESIPFTHAVLAFKIPFSHPISFARVTLLLTQQQQCDFEKANAKKNSRGRAYKRSTGSLWWSSQDEFTYNFKTAQLWPLPSRRGCGRAGRNWSLSCAVVPLYPWFCFLWFQLNHSQAWSANSKWKILEIINKFKLLITICCHNYSIFLVSC